MSKLVVKNTEGMKTPFLRGILTSSLLDAGIDFDLAYKIASKIRQLTNSMDEIRTVDLREMIVKQIEGSTDKKVLDRFLAVTDYASTIMIKRLNQHVEPFSRAKHRLCMEACGLSGDDASNITLQIYNNLLNSGMREISGIHLGRETYKILFSQMGEKLAKRYIVWSDFIHSDKMLVILIGGTSGVGKSTIATEVGHRVGIVRTQSTDMLREVMRMMTPQALSPVLHTSSYNAWKVQPDIPDDAKMTPQLLMSGYLRQTELLSVACEAIINRALKEKVSLILEGVHIHPSLLEKIPKESNAIIAPIMLSVLKAGKLKEHIKGRGERVPDRRSQRYLDNFNAIWELQSYLMAETDRHRLPIVSNIDKENAIQEVMKAVNDRLYPHFSDDVDKVFPDDK